MSSTENYTQFNSTSTGTNQFDQALIEACQQNDIESVKKLIEMPEIDLQAQDCKAFLTAAQNKDFNIMTLFLEQHLSTCPKGDGQKMFQIAKNEVPEIAAFVKLAEDVMEKVGNDPQLYISSESEREAELGVFAKTPQIAF